MDFYLGLTGLPGAGKEAVSKLIAVELAAHDIQTLHYSLSGPIALELQRRGLPPDREQYRAVANEVRANLGNGAWAKRVALEIQETLERIDWTNIVVIIDGIRNPSEVMVFRKLWGSRFKLLAINAPEYVRSQNLRVRSSPKDAIALKHLAANELAAPLIKSELGIDQPQHGTNVPACMELADWTIDNNEHDASMSALRITVQAFVARDLLPSVI